MQLANLLHKQKIFTAKHTVILCGLVSVLFYLYLAQHSQEFGQASFNNLISCVFPCALLSFFAWYHLHITQESHALSSKELCFYIIVFAVLFRAIGFFIFPILEDDFYRYLWDGYILNEQGSPYVNAPSAYFGLDSVPENFELILDGINYPEIATVYGPFCQWIFGLAYLIAPGQLWVLKLLVLIAELILLVTVIVLMRTQSIKWYYLLLYAWSPLLIIQFVVSAHPDVFAVMFIFIALLARQGRYFLLMAGSLALAVASKVFAIIIVPILLGFHWKRWLVFIFTAIAVSWPLGLLEAWIPEGLKAMAQHWYFNAPIYHLFSSLDFTLVKISLLLGFSLFYLWGWYAKWWLRENTLVRGDIIFGLFLLVLPALNTWYLIFILPFGVFYASRTLWAASVLIFLSYVFIENEILINSGWVLAAEFVTLLLILLLDFKSKPMQLNAS